MDYYIHYADPGFPDPPWPGQRRLGPYLTLVEAQAQAVENSASGFGNALGIWDEDGSETQAQEGAKTPAAAVEAATIADLGAARAADYDEDRRLQFQTDTLARGSAPLDQIAANQAELAQRITDRAAADATALKEGGAT